MAVALLLVLLAVAGAWNHELWAYDEPREVELARAMYRSGNYAVMELGGLPFLDKPPLFCQSIALAFHLTGPSLLVARLVTAAWALTTLALTAWLARRALGPRTGLLAALVLATSYRFYGLSREVLLDNALTTFTTASIGLAAFASRERSLRLAALGALALAGAFLTKGVVGVGIVGLVLLVDLVARRDGRGLAVLLHPLSFVAFLGPIALYLGALSVSAGPEARDYLRELFWSNQFGRFLGTHGQKASNWYLYFETWPEMLAFWVPAAALAIVHATRVAWRGEKAPAWCRFALVWAVAPLVVLSFSKGRARPYVLPALPGYALLVALWWRDLGEVPRWARLTTVAITSALAATVAGAVVAIGVLAPDRLDALEVGGALLAVAAAGLWLFRREEASFPSSEAGALSFGCIVLAAFLVYSGRFMAAYFDRVRGYSTIAAEVAREAGGREIALYHLSNSWSGAFGFTCDRTAPEYDQGYDEKGTKLLTELKPAGEELVLTQLGTLGAMDRALRSNLAVVWTGTRADDDCPAYRYKMFVLLERRRAGEPPHDPMEGLPRLAPTVSGQ
jgi:4-amino-4-deoxy-L-arabinose transferase-like glycosyltransferase